MTLRSPVGYGCGGVNNFVLNEFIEVEFFDYFNMMDCMHISFFHLGLKIDDLITKTNPFILKILD